jgi:hypothetical protein
VRHGSRYRYSRISCWTRPVTAASGSFYELLIHPCRLRKRCSTTQKHGPTTALGSRHRILLSLGLQNYKSAVLLSFLLAAETTCTVTDRSTSKAPAVQRSEPPAKLPPPAKFRRMLIDIPSLAFARRDGVNSILGMPRRAVRNSNMTTWSEGTVESVFYSRAECTFLTGRLISITYKFKTPPKTVQDALEWSGLPREAAALDNAHPDHLPFRAFYPRIPNTAIPFAAVGCSFNGSPSRKIEASFGSISQTLTSTMQIGPRKSDLPGCAPAQSRCKEGWTLRVRVYGTANEHQTPVCVGWNRRQGERALSGHSKLSGGRVQRGRSLPICRISFRFRTWAATTCAAGGNGLRTPLISARGLDSKMLWGVRNTGP